MNKEDKDWLGFNLDYIKSIMENNDNKNSPLMDPFSFDSYDHLFEGIVKEYITLDSGLLELSDVANSTVLFNMKQAYKIVNEEGENKWKRLKSEHLKQTDSKLLREHFPIGSTVKLIVRRIPCYEHSHLRFQAAAIFPGSFSNIDAPMDDFKLRFDTEGSKQNLFKTLVRQHNDFKMSSSFKTNFRVNKAMVMSVLDELSDNWYASIIMNYDDGCGLIRLTAKTGVLNPAWSASVNYLNVLFHLEDVYDSDGHQVIRNNCNIRDLLSAPVTLTARSICRRQLPSGIIETLEEMLSSDPSNIGIPVLQAITVRLLTKGTKNVDEGLGIQMPRPTIIRKNTPSLNFKGDFTSCFFQYGLKTKLDIKICNFNAIYKTPLPYKEHITAKFEYKEEKELLHDMKDLNSDTSRFLVYGELDLNLVDVTQQKHLPKEITKIECKIVYLHRPTLKVERGVALIKPIVDGDPVPCFSYFQWSDVSKLVAHDYHCKDLAALTPCNSSDTFYITVTLLNHDSAIPYVARQIWNETVRVRHGQFEPVPDSMSDTIRFRETFIKAFLSTARYDKKKEKTSVKAGLKKEIKVDRRSTLEKLVDDKTKENVVIGRVMKLINQNYGIGVCIKKPEDGPTEKVQVLFDVFDVWRGDAVLSTLGKKLPDELAVGQYILVNAILIEKKENVKRSVDYMATAVVAAESLEELRGQEFPGAAVLLKSADKLDANKINNFKAVVNVVSNMDLNNEEKIVIDEINRELLHKQKEYIKPRVEPDMKKEIKVELVDEHKNKIASFPATNQNETVKNFTETFKNPTEVASFSASVIDNNAVNGGFDSLEVEKLKFKGDKNTVDKIDKEEIVAGLTATTRVIKDSKAENGKVESSTVEKLKFKSNRNDNEECGPEPAATTKEAEGRSDSDGVLIGKEEGVLREDDSLEDVSVVSASEENSKDEGSHDKLDCDNKDNLDVSRESIEMALSDMLEAANDVIKSLESESQL